MLRFVILYALKSREVVSSYREQITLIVALWSLSVHLHCWTLCNTNTVTSADSELDCFDMLVSRTDELIGMHVHNAIETGVSRRHNRNLVDLYAEEMAHGCLNDLRPMNQIKHAGHILQYVHVGIKLMCGFEKVCVALEVSLFVTLQPSN